MRYESLWLMHPLKFTSCILLALALISFSMLFFLEADIKEIGYIKSYHIISYLISYHIISYHIISYHIISYHIISHHIPYHIIPYHISYNITSYTISYHIIYHIISYHIISYHIISYHIISYHINQSYHISCNACKSYVVSILTCNYYKWILWCSIDKNQE